MTDTPAADLEADVTLLGRIPLPHASVKGRLRLSETRLDFQPFPPSDPSYAVDASLSELHSPARSQMGLQLWQGDKRLRFAFPKSAATNGTVADEFLLRLTPEVGSPPPGMQVQRPWPRWAWLAATIGGYVVLMALVVVLLELVR